MVAIRHARRPQAFILVEGRLRFDHRPRPSPRSTRHHPPTPHEPPDDPPMGHHPHSVRTESHTFAPGLPNKSTASAQHMVCRAVLVTVRSLIGSLSYAEVSMPMRVLSRRLAP